MGSSQETLSIPVKLHQWGSDTGASLPERRQATRESPSQQPVSAAIDMHISRVGQKYHNPDPLLQLIGPANDVTILIGGQQFLALIDSGAQLSTMSESLESPGSSGVSVGIRNIICQSITIPAKTVIAKVAAANVVPHSFAPNVESNEQL